MDGATNNNSGPSTTNITGYCHTSPVLIETVSRPLFSSDYYRKVDKTTDIAGRLPNTVYTLPPHIVQAIVGLAKVTDETRMALVAECKKFFLASREYEENKVVFVDGEGNRSTTIALDCGRLYSEGNNGEGQCGIGSEEDEVTGPRLIRLPPVLQVWYCTASWIVNTTRGLYAWGMNLFSRLGNGQATVTQPRRVPIDGDVLDVSLLPYASFFRTASGWFGCGANYDGQLGLGHTDDEVTAPTPIPGSEGVTRWADDDHVTLAFTDGGILACGINRHGQCGVGSTDDIIATLTPVAVPEDVKGRVDRVVCNGGSSFFIAGRRCFAAGFNRHGRLGLGSNEWYIHTPTELLIPVDDVIADNVTVIQSGAVLLAFGNNRNREISINNRFQFNTPTPFDLPGPVVKIIVDWKNVFIQLAGGAWVGRGMYCEAAFIPVPEGDLINMDFLPGWTSVNDDYAEELNFREPDVDVMFLPEPIAMSPML